MVEVAVERKNERRVLRDEQRLGCDAYALCGKPVDLVGLATVVAAAIDPTVARPPAVRRVLSTLPGITHIGPVEIEPELDLPLWSFLSSHAPDWMLPGAGDLVDGDVVALSTNPVFVESLLVGANHQATAELRWRNIPLVTRWSPLRKFWERKANDVDILPIKAWPDVAPLGGSLVEWASHAHAELFVASGQLDVERERVIREANELATMLLGEQTFGSTVERALARVIQIRGGG